jgi:hypothetical protein
MGFNGNIPSGKIYPFQLSVSSSYFPLKTFFFGAETAAELALAADVMFSQ